MIIRMRDYHWEKDFESCRRFLANIFSIRKTYTNWIPSELENLKFGPGGTEYEDGEDEYLKIWEAFDETQQNALRITAISYTKPSGNCWLSVHPNDTSVVREIVLWMQNRVKEVEMKLVVDDKDETLILLLSDFGFSKGEIEGDKQIRPIDSPVPTYSLPEGYTIRNAVIEKDFKEYREVQMTVFPHIVSMSKELLKVYSTASFYREDLDIVAVGPDGKFTAFCTARIDPRSKIAELEPVGTHPDHRKLGLARAVICESLKRLEKHEPSAVVILGAAPTDGARRLYESVGFVNEGARHYWVHTV
ncbi:GNAT family N-acetyltransferase [Candidatus Bathyarchaeota archaeon]|nr:GNAT family N-acetyltransferase [Candidatus Bathyarchaeota archaeon]